jgi:TfoX/Sxy family transcriptional regulator of competence genes
MGSRASGDWTKSPPELVDSFLATTSELPGVEQRQMFGYPAAFANGHLVTSLHQARWIVRLPEDGLAKLERLGATPFEPMPGRPMRGYAAFPADMVANPEALRPWLERALAHVLQMPPKKGR